MAITPDGKSLYELGTDPRAHGVLLQYDIGADGGLTAKNPSGLGLGFGTSYGLAVSPDGRSVYVGVPGAGAGPSTVFQFDVGPGGALVPKTPSTVPAGDASVAIAVGPLSKKHATAIGVACSPGTFAPGDGACAG